MFGYNNKKHKSEEVNLVYKYKDYVSNIEIIGNNVYRYLISFTLKEAEYKSALVILQNPSKASKDISDQTVNKVLDVLHNFKYEKVYLTNLIPYYGTSSKEISEMVKGKSKVFKENDEIIKEKIETVDKIFVAWGGRNGFDLEFYNSRLSSIRKLLENKDVYCYKINRNGTPIHPTRNQWKVKCLEEDFIKYTLYQ